MAKSGLSAWLDKGMQEAKKLGFETVILPEVNRAATESMKGIRLIYVAGIRDAISYIMR